MMYYYLICLHQHFIRSPEAVFYSTGALAVYAVKTRSTKTFTSPCYIDIGQQETPSGVFANDLSFMTATKVVYPCTSLLQEASNPHQSQTTQNAVPQLLKSYI